MKFVPLVGLVEIGDSFGLAQVRSQAVVPHLWFVEEHLDQGTQALRPEVGHLAALHPVVQPRVPLAHPHHVVAHGLRVRAVGGQVHGVELVGGVGPGAAVRDRGLGDQRVGQLRHRGEAEVCGLGGEPAPAGQQRLAHHHIPAASQLPITVLSAHGRAHLCIWSEWKAPGV